MSQTLVFDADATYDTPPANSLEFVSTPWFRKLRDQADESLIASPALDLAPNDVGYFSLAIEDPERVPFGSNPREWVLNIRMKTTAAGVITPSLRVVEDGATQVVLFDTFAVNLGTDLQSFVFFGSSFPNTITDLTTLQVDIALQTSVAATLSVGKVMLLAPVYWTEE